MTVAERTRQAVRDRPFLFDALRAGVCNYSAAARLLDAEDEEAAVAALRRFADELDAPDPPAGDARVTMAAGLGVVPPEDALLVVGDTALGPEAGSLTGLLATGDPGPRHLRLALGRCETAGVSVTAAGLAGDAMLVVVARRDGPDALRRVEGVFG
jgi:hypothetical protein